MPKIIEDQGVPDLENDENWVKKYKKDGDDKRVLKYLANFVACLASQSDEVFYYAFKIMKLAISLKNTWETC